jgi:hypothetical protein
MDISPANLERECRAARAQWPYIDVVEADHRLARGLLYAMGSRETNLTNVRGDGGHGHGVWQLDDRWHTIPPGFDKNVELQAVAAAAMFVSMLAATKDLVSALDIYNSGQPRPAGTTGGDYGPDVAARLDWITHHVPPVYLPPLITLNSHGAMVTQWQAQMLWRRWPLAVDGWYGPKSATACQAFQKQQRLAVDGVVGPATWAATWTAL